MSTLFLINYHFKRINFCIKFESALQPHSPLSLRFSDDIAVSPHTDHRLSVSDSDNLRRSEEIGFLHILTFQQMLRQKAQWLLNQEAPGFSRGVRHFFLRNLNAIRCAIIF